jgi:hypothetical protein
VATVTAFTAARSLAIENSSVVSGSVDGLGNLSLITRGGDVINAGNIMGPPGSPVNNLELTVKNMSGSTMAKGTAVYISGATGDNPLISKAQANSEATSSKTLGLLTNFIATDDTGTVTTEGLLTGLDTSAATAGDPVWLSGTTPGGLVYGLANKPVAPTHMVYIGVVVRAHQQQGVIYVKVQNGFELDELHDVTITSPTATQLLGRNSGNTAWVNKSLSDDMMPEGSILQVVSSTLTTTPSTTSTSFVATGLSVTITPRSNTSKFFLRATVNNGTTTTTGQINYFAFARGTTPIGVGVSGTTINVGAAETHAGNDRMIATNLSWLDAPSTASAVTYNLYYASYSASNTLFLNRRGADLSVKGASSLIVMEVAG